jgi:hypothetical protein
MRMIVAILLYAFVLSAVDASAQPDNTADFFDKPLKIERIPLPKDQFSGSQSEPALSCFHYGSLTIKQIDTGQIGAEQLSLLPRGAGQPPAACTKENIPGEKVLSGPKWGGYFWGVRAEYAFIESADGWSGGSGIAVFAIPGGEEVFQDTVDNGLQGIEPTANGLALRYRRVYFAPCSLYANLAACWDKVKQETELTGEAPDCSAAYFPVIERNEDGAEESAAFESVIEYEVVTLLEGAGATTKPLPGKLECRLPD